MKEKVYMKQASAARELGLSSRQVLNNWVRRGNITAHEVDGRVCVCLDEVREYMDKGENK